MHSGDVCGVLRCFVVFSGVQADSDGRTKIIDILLIVFGSNTFRHY